MKLTETQDLLTFAIDCAYHAGRLTLQYFNTPPQVEWKADMSPVTQADKESETLLRQYIETQYPTHSIVGEEFGESHGSSGFCWVLDPIDGTRSFARGFHIYGVQIALEHDGEPILGLVYFPVLDEMVAAGKDLGCRVNGRRCNVSKVSQMSEALIFAHNQDIIDRRCPEFAALQNQTYLSRNWGDCYSFVSVATGRADIAVDPRMEPWDSGPMITILEEAGGRFTSWSGERTIWGPDALATNGVLHDEVLALLKQARP